MTKSTEKKMLSKKEVENLTSLQQQQNDLVFGLGQIELQSIHLQKQKEYIKQQLEALENSQVKTSQELEEKYGQGTINLENGEFIQS